jgi:hypothetical protein
VKYRLGVYKSEIFVEPVSSLCRFLRFFVLKTAEMWFVKSRNTRQNPLRDFCLNENLLRL